VPGLDLARVLTDRRPGPGRELNNSLTIALGHLELIPTDGLASEDVEHVEICQGALLEMARTIERLRVAEDRVVSYIGDHGMIDLRGDADS
jgi:hypothetical protein